MSLFLPELLLLLAGLVLFLVSLGNPDGVTVRRLSIALGSFVLIATIAGLGATGSLFYETYRIDLFSQVFKFFIAAATLIVLIFSGDSPGIKKDVRAEYYLFLFTGVLGLMMLVSSVELLAIFISLELSSFAVYIMVPMRSAENTSGYQMEAGAKYLLFGVMATGFMLFGMSYMYGLTGSTFLDTIVSEMSYMYNQPAAVVAVIMVMAGFFYKLAIFPFHFWVPDVYEGAANETTSFIASVPKIAAVALLLRLVTMISVDGQAIVNLLLICSIGSMFFGNLSALVQKDLKRMLGYSGVSHAGFILFGLLTFQADGYSTALYYTVGYAVMSLACFLVICCVAAEGNNLRIEDMTGLYKRSPLLALTLATGLFALAGIPPFVGFTGKFMLLVNGLKQGYIIPVVLAAFNTAIALYYYLSVVRVAYCTAPEENENDKVRSGLLTNIASVMLLLIIVGMGVMPSRFLDFAGAVISSIM